VRKTTLVLAAFLGLSLAGATSGFAAVYVFNPDPADVCDLDHYRYYTWGIDWAAQGETITDVVLTFSNIRNWEPEENSLFIHLLDDAPSNLTVGIDNVPGISDYFAGEGYLIDEWTDPKGGWPGVDLSYSFSELGIIDNFAGYAADGNVGLAFDPDCHYYNEGISLTVITNAPEPATLLLFALGLAGGVAVRRKVR
jgi:hypothetical protein